MVDTKLNKALYDLFQVMLETACDMYWGSQNVFSDKEIEEFSTKDYQYAEKCACLEMIERSAYGWDFPYQTPEELEDKSIPIDKCYGALGDLYGKYLRIRQTEKSLGLYLS